MVCPVCANTLVSTKTVKFIGYVTCKVCEASFILDQSKVVYKENYFFDNRSSLFGLISQPLWTFLLRRKVRMIKEVLPNSKSRVLDYGCGMGRLVKELNSMGVRAIGWDPSKSAVKLAKNNLIPVESKLSAVGGEFGLIMMWHSLEHSDHPFLNVKQLSKMLGKDGKLLIAVPNADSLEAKLLGDKWFHLTYPLHRIQFTPRSIRLMLTRLGFKHMRFDYFNPDYTFSGLIQSLLNTVLPMNVMYATMTNRRSELSYLRSIVLTGVSLFLVIVFLPVIVIIYLALLILKKTDAIVVTAWM